MKMLFSLTMMCFLSVASTSTKALAADPSDVSFKDVLGACKVETSTQCGDAKTEKSQVSCLTKKSSDPKAKFTNGCRQKIADKKN